MIRHVSQKYHISHYVCTVCFSVTSYLRLFWYHASRRLYYLPICYCWILHFKTFLVCFTYTSIIAQFSVCCWICSQFCPARFPETLSRLYPSKHLLSKQTKTYSRLKNWGSSHQMALNNFVKRESRSSVETEGQRDEWAVRLKKGRNILVQIPWGVWHGAHICHQNYYSLHMYNIFQF